MIDNAREFVKEGFILVPEEYEYDNSYYDEGELCVEPDSNWLGLNSEESRNRASFKADYREDLVNKLSEMGEDEVVVVKYSTLKNIKLNVTEFFANFDGCDVDFNYNKASKHPDYVEEKEVPCKKTYVTTVGHLLDDAGVYYLELFERNLEKGASYLNPNKRPSLEVEKFDEGSTEKILDYVSFFGIKCF